jgi:hypothetical protein
VMGKDASGRFQLWSPTSSFTIYGGTIALLPPVPNGDGTVTWNGPSPSWSWTYAGSGFTKFYLQIANNATFSGSANYDVTLPMPSASVAGPPIVLTQKQWNTVLNLREGRTGLMYWRVKAMAPDGIFFIYSPTGSFAWQ